MRIACIVLASGNSKRFKKSKSKLFYKVFGSPLIEYTLKNLIKYINKDAIYITIQKKITKNEKNLLLKYTSNELIIGGNTRFKSLKNVLKVISQYKYDAIMIHDAARPNTPSRIINSLVKEIKSKQIDCSVPSMRVEDTIRYKNETLDRSNYTIYQTPQIFKSNIILKNVNKITANPTDDLGIVEHNKKLKIKYINYSKENIKVTSVEDINIFKKLISKKFLFGNGFDIHQIKEGKYLMLAGLKIKSKYKAIGYSDGDVVLHSLIDALLGALKIGDIGEYFPALPMYKNISSTVLLYQIKQKINMSSIIINELDCTIICQKTRLEKYKKDIAKNLSKLLDCELNKINIKAKTSDNIGMIGKSKAIACWSTLKLLKI